MVKKLNLDAMSVGEIWQLHQMVIEVLATRLTAEKHELDKRLAQLRREQQQSLALPSEGASRWLAGDQDSRKHAKVPPKYRNPNEPSETWSGRGKRPRWLTQALLAGQKIEDFVISASEPQDGTLHEA
ncbi:H-NS family nucleoid-associated regulatory protein [Bradyrhizobium sp. STM 3557]|uniref:H-NS histone family protein n=1 Tax=Bradyrhizobium sp. STM 3557 TaxID=578920 RepID=UPI00388EDF25